MKQESYSQEYPGASENETINPADFAEKKRVEIRQIVDAYFSFILTESELSTDKTSPERFMLHLGNKLEGELRDLLDKDDQARVDSGYQPDTYFEIKRITLEELMSKLDEMRLKDGMDPVNKIIKYLYENHFSYTPNFLQGISMSDELILSGEMRRHPGFEQLVSHCVHEFAYDATFGQILTEEEVNELLSKQSVSEQLDFLSGTEYVINVTASESYSGNGFVNLYRLVSFYKTNSPFPIVKLRAETILNQAITFFAFNEDVELEPEEILAAEKFQSLKNLAWAESKSLEDLYNLPKSRNVRYSRIDHHTIGVHRGDMLQEMVSVDDGNTEKNSRVWFDTYLLQPQVLPFADQKQRTNDQMLFQNLHTLQTRKMLEEKLGFTLSEIPVRAQFHLLRFSADKSSDVFDRLLSVTQRKGIDREAFFSSFFACAEDVRIGTLLLDFSENEDIEQVNKIFREYSIFVNETNSIENLINRFFSKQTNDIDTREVVREIFSRGNKKLQEVISSSSRGKTSDQYEASSIDTLSAEATMFGALFMTAFKKAASVDFSEIKGLDYRSMSVNELVKHQPDLAKSMLAIAKSNYATGDTQAKKLFETVEELLTNGGMSEFYILTKKTDKSEDVIAFVRYDTVDQKGHRKGGSFNVNPLYRGSAFGQALFERALTDVSVDSVIDATVFAKIPVGMFYVEKKHFLITGVDTDFGNSGETHYIIQRDNLREKNLRSCNRELYSEEKLLSLLDHEVDC